MHTDLYGQQIFDEADLCALFLQEPTRQLSNVLIRQTITFDPDLELENLPKLMLYQDPKVTLAEFDEEKQNKWWMPDEYHTLDIAKWVLDQCSNEDELQRAGDELLKYDERKMFTLLQYLKYLVDTMRRHNIVWGVGRGSSVASFVLYLIGIHKINSLYYDLDINEFLK
jgi:DNA polymerase III alpha subunit